MQASKVVDQAAYNNRWRSLLFICTSLLVIALDNTILNVALPSISNQLGASASDLQWIVDAYILVFAALLLTMGSIGDRIGRKRSLQFGLVMFGIGSTIAGLSNSTEMLIATRAFMGIGGATIMPATLSIVTATFREPKERSQAIALWAAVFGLGVGLGPVIGGWLLERFHWNAVFFVNIPVVIVALIGGFFYIQDSRDEHAPTPDVVGVVLSILGLFALVYGIIEAGMDGWTADNVLLAFAAAAVLLGIFGVWESRAPNAMLPIRFFRNMSFTGANTALALVTFSLFGAMFFLPQYFQSVQGYTALEAGILTMPMALVIMGASALSARIVQRTNLKITVTLGFISAASGMFYLSQFAHADTPFATVFVGMALIGMGMGLAMPPATDSIMGSVPVSKAGVGSAMNDTTRQLGGALGVAVLGTVMANTYGSMVDAIPGIAQMPAQALAGIESSIQGAHMVAAQAPAAFQQAIIDGSNNAFVTGMNDAMFVAGFIMAAAAVITFILLPAVIRPSTEDDDREAAEQAEADRQFSGVPVAGD